MKIARFKEYTINEGYEENPEYRMKNFLDEFEKNVRKWFESGSFAANGATLTNMARSMSDGIEKNVIVDFEDEKGAYQLYVIISIKDVGEEKLDEVFVKIKKYDKEGTLVNTLKQDIKVKDLNEDTIMQMIAKVDEVKGTDDNMETDEIV